jgi:biopolymer transport protein ExbD
MTWKVRHEGSPKAVEVPTAQQVAQGLAEGMWEPSDEVMGPEDPAWVPLEAHPTFAEVAAEVEPPPPRHYDDETHLDMNALIDVCLVLLIFFIMTTTYAAMQTRIDAADINQNPEGIPVVAPKEVSEQMIHVQVKLEDGQPVFFVEKKKVPKDNLRAELGRAKSGTARNILLLEVEPKVPHSESVYVQDCAFGSFNKVLRLLPQK